MDRHNNFSIGFLRTQKCEQLFLSVSPGFELGPGILRNGITKPRMTDPHHVAYVRAARNLNLPRKDPTKTDYTKDPFLQRAGTWTLYHHVKEFINKVGEEWKISGIQSCGDLTMNPWHVAYISDSHIAALKGKLCALQTEEDKEPMLQEPINDRVYRSLVKWRPDATYQGNAGVGD